MKLFLDASAIVAMLADEPDALLIADRLDGYDELCWSPIVIWEATAAMTRIRKLDVIEAREYVLAFGKEWQVRLVSIAEAEGRLALEALHRYGKGSGHPARLNMGDCFSYGCAKAHQADLLYKGDDFARTDLA